MYEVTCPACGAISEGKDRDELYLEARAHTLDEHAYDVPREHIDKDARLSGSSGTASRDSRSVDGAVG